MSRLSKSADHRVLITATALNSRVAPAELEAIILTFHKVADCAVVPLEDLEKATEYPLAFIVPKPEYKEAMFIGLETRMWVDRRVAHYKRLKGGVRVVDRIPKRFVPVCLHAGLHEADFVHA